MLYSEAKSAHILSNLRIAEALGATSTISYHNIISSINFCLPPRELLPRFKIIIMMMMMMRVDATNNYFAINAARQNKNTNRHTDIQYTNIKLQHIQRITTIYYKKLSYRRGTARGVVSIEILPIT